MNVNSKELTKLTATYLGYRRRTEVCEYPPTRVWVEPTSDCNLRCSFCLNRQFTNEQRGYMDFGLYTRLADEASGRVRQFNLFHRGESLLHPRLIDMVDYATQRGIRTRIHTNGTLLRPDLAKGLIEAGLDVISFSFDGYDRLMYENNRPNARFDTVLGNIMDVLKTKRRLGLSRPFVAVETMEIADCGPAELAAKRTEFRRRLRGLPVDKFVVRRPHNWGGLVDSESLGAGPQRNPRRIPCPLLWHALVVLWDGTVLPCPQDFFGALEIGDLRRERLVDVWNGEPLRTLRRQFADPNSEIGEPCANCDRIVRATVAGIPTDYLGRFVSETVLSNSWLGRFLPH